MKSIKLTNGQSTIVDNDDYHALKGFIWYLDNDGYVLRRGPKETGWRFIKMHRLIAGTPDGLDTDHINGNRLDNRKCNLRICTRGENLRNRGKPKNNKTGYKGVHYCIVLQAFVAQIGFRYKVFNLGSFSTALKAHNAYKKAAAYYHGEFARTN